MFSMSLMRLHLIRGALLHPAHWLWQVRAEGPEDLPSPLSRDPAAL